MPAWLAVLLGVALTLCVRGYRYGESNHAVYLVDALRRVNGIRRLFAYRTYADRRGLQQHMKQHLRLLELLERQSFAEAARLMVRHLRSSPLSAQ